MDDHSLNCEDESQMPLIARIEVLPNVAGKTCSEQVVTGHLDRCLASQLLIFELAGTYLAATSSTPYLRRSNPGEDTIYVRKGGYPRMKWLPICMK